MPAAGLLSNSPDAGRLPSLEADSYRGIGVSTSSFDLLYDTVR